MCLLYYVIKFSPPTFLIYHHHSTRNHVTPVNHVRNTTSFQTQGVERLKNSTFQESKYKEDIMDFERMVIPKSWRNKPQEDALEYRTHIA